MSIFTKDCPQCAETNATYAVRCKCGFAFGTDVADVAAQTEEEVTLEEEKLYQEYLAARAKQNDVPAADDAAKQAPAQTANSKQLEKTEQTKTATGLAQTAPKSQHTATRESTSEKRPAKAPATTAALTQRPVASATPTTPKASTAPKPSTPAKQSWLISDTESDISAAAPAQPPAARLTPTPAKPIAIVKPATTNATPDAAKASAAELAKKLEQRLKAVQTKRARTPATTSTGTTNKVDTKPPTAAPKSDAPSTSTTASLSMTLSETSAAPTIANTEDSIPSNKPANAKSDQPGEPASAAEPKKVNGNKSAPATCDPIAVSTADKETSVPGTSATAKHDLEAALQALNATASGTDAATPVSTEGGHEIQKETQGLLEEAQELLDASDPAPLGEVTQDDGLGCTEKECPNCTALVAMGAETCGCGFAFPPDDDAMPSLSLSDSDVEALEKRKKSSGIRRLG